MLLLLLLLLFTWRRDLERSDRLAGPRLVAVDVVVDVPRELLLEERKRFYLFV